MNEATDIGRAVQRLLDAYERLAVARRRELGLNANEEAALRLIRQGTSAPSEISRTIGMTTAGVTNMLDRLEAGGLVRRERHQTDKRRVLLTLTKLGFRGQLELDAVHARVASLASADAGASALACRFLDDAATLVEDAASGDQHDRSHRGALAPPEQVGFSDRIPS